MLKVEEEKFKDTLLRGEGMVKRIAADLKSKGTGKLSSDTLAELYDSHGLPPEIVKQAAEKEGVDVEVPENFYALIASRHMAAPKPVEENIFHMPEEEQRKRGIGVLPANLGDAIALTEKSDLVRKALGDAVFEAFIKNKKIEWDKYRVQVTDYETRTYLPIL
jgi:hypothetical protein